MPQPQTELTVTERARLLNHRLTMALDDIGGLDDLRDLITPVGAKLSSGEHVVVTHIDVVDFDTFDKIVRRLEDVAKWKPSDRQHTQESHLI